MAEEQQFCLRWNNFQVNITSQFEALRDEEDFVDVTLACEGKRLKAHKVVLSACSPYFKDLFKSNPCKHPILFMRDVEFRHLQSLVEFMYAGEVNVAQAQLSSFLRTAESLQIRGLTEAPQRHKQMDGNVQGTTSSSHHTASSPGDNSRANASSPEEEGDDDDVLSLSPPSTPPPAKRQCRDQDDASHGPSVHTNQGDSVKNEVPDMVEPKVEAPDYSSDGESKQDGGAMSASFMGLDNSVDMNTSFTGLHGGMEILPGTSTQSFMGETSQDSTQGIGLRSILERPLPLGSPKLVNLPHGAIRRRGRPRLQQLEEWQQSTHMLAGSGMWRVGSPKSDPMFVPPLTTGNGLVSLVEGVQVPAEQLRNVNWCDYRKMTRGLAAILFSPHELATCSVTGQRWSRAGYCGERATKPALDRDKVRAIIQYVLTRFPNVEMTKIKQVLAYKCKEMASSLKVKMSEPLLYPKAEPKDPLGCEQL
ncbi:protein abrupt isoform X3 [Anabrus simplex]|uniref:protein abrupt isoform X3 n=1 Tax=Anabrus simplex TaxID=316456 RepID=UPI0034DD9D33